MERKGETLEKTKQNEENEYTCGNKISELRSSFLPFQLPLLYTTPLSFQANTNHCH